MKHYCCRSTRTGETEHNISFSARDFNDAGVPYASLAGMPILEAYQLVNRWNARQSHYVYWIEN